MMFKRKPKRVLVFDTPAERTTFFNKEHEKLTELKECIYSGQPNKDEIKFIAWRRRSLFKEEKASYKADKRGNTSSNALHLNKQALKSSKTETQEPSQPVLVQSPQQLPAAQLPQTTTEIKAVSVKKTTTNAPIIPDEIFEEFQAEMPPDGDYYG